MSPVTPTGSIRSRMGTEQHRVRRPMNTGPAPEPAGDMIDRLLPQRR